MNTARTIFASVIILGLTTACSNSKNEIYTAPVSSNAGIMVKGEAADLNKLTEQPGVTFRTLSAGHGVIEVHGLDQETIHNIAPNLETEKNKYFSNLLPSESSSSVFKRLASANGSIKFDELIKESEEAGQSLPPILEGCDVSIEDQRPTASIGVDFQLDPKTLTMSLSEEAKFKGSDSLANPEFPGALEHRWDVLAPALSNHTPEVIMGEQFAVTPDNVGIYRVVLVVKDQRNACDVASGAFMVTTNPELDLPSADTEKPSVELENFKHLDRVNAQQAWEKSTGKGVTIAVLDTGLNFNHRAISWNLAINQSELDGQAGQDDDTNKFEDDYLGWDFINGDNNPFDDEGHGSHVSGISASHIFGIAKDAKILPVKVLNAGGGGDIASVLAGIYYAVDNGADVINASLGASADSFKMLQEGIEYAKSKGVLFVAAAGNGDAQGISMDLSQPGVDVWPAELPVDNILTVAATNENNQLTSYSNYGFDQVDVAAPGGSGTEPIWSLATANAQGFTFNPSAGTSMASPLVAGIAALVLEKQEDLSPTEAIDILMKAGNKTPALEGKIGSEKVIDALHAVDLAAPNLM